MGTATRLVNNMIFTLAFRPCKYLLGTHECSCFAAEAKEEDQVGVISCLARSIVSVAVIMPACDLTVSVVLQLAVMDRLAFVLNFKFIVKEISL